MDALAKVGRHPHILTMATVIGSGIVQSTTWITSTLGRETNFVPLHIADLRDALAAMDYLHKRELLCSSCGWNMATVRNQFKSHCGPCTPKHGDFSPIKAANEFERCICDALHEWLTSNTAEPHPDAESASEPVTDPSQVRA